MSSTIASFFLLIPLFYLLGLTAEFIISKIKILAVKLGVGVGILGAILGLLTTLPEISVGISAIALGKSELSIGNLIGGLMVLFCLILGIALVLNRKIKTDGKSIKLIPFFLFLLSPILLGIKGYLGFWDGLFMILSYLLFLRFMFIGNAASNNSDDTKVLEIEIRSAWKEFVLIISGAFIIVIISSLIVRMGINIIETLSVSPFVMGLIVFSLGTNLPELAVSIESWRQNASEISLSNLMGSAAANILVIGWISVLKSTSLTINTSYYFTLISLLIVTATVLYFYKSERKLTRQEGYVLLTYYLMFVIGQSIFS